MNLVERVIGKIRIALSKRDLNEIRRAREWRYHLKNGVPRESAQITLMYVRKEIVDEVTQYYRAT